MKDDKYKGIWEFAILGGLLFILLLTLCLVYIAF